MRWIRVASRISQDAKVWQLAERAGCSAHQAIGHLVALWGAMTEQAKDGNLAGVPDSLVETWAEWSGKRGRFAAAVRATLCDDAGVITAWEKYQGAAIREAEADKRRADARRKSGKSPADSLTDRPPERPADRPREVRRYENETSTKEDLSSSSSTLPRTEQPTSVREAASESATVRHVRPAEPVARPTPVVPRPLAAATARRMSVAGEFSQIAERAAQKAERIQARRNGTHGGDA